MTTNSDHILTEFSKTLAELQKTIEQLRHDTAPIPYAAQMIVGATLDDLVRLTGASRNFCKEMIRAGKLPGEKIGELYVVPDLALHLWRLGMWQPQNQPLDPPSTRVPVPMVHSVPSKKAGAA